MSEPTPPPLSDEAARRQRQEALRALAQSQLGTPAEPDPARASSQPVEQRLTSEARSHTVHRRLPWLAGGSALLVLVLVVGLILHQLGVFPGLAAKSHSGPTSVVIAPHLQGQDCLQDVSWSPDGQQVAVLGYRDQCPNDDPSSYNYQAGVLHIYAAATGRLLRTILPDPTVLALPGIPAAPANAQPTSVGADTSKPVINYNNVLWSPNGQQLALTFYIGHVITLTTANSTVNNYVIEVRGLVLVNADGTGERAAFLKAKAASQQFDALRWDTSTLSALALPSQPHFGDFASLPPAASYSWSANGQLVPGSPLTGAPASATTPIGNPDGGSSFTIWQPGNISLTTRGFTNDSSVTIIPGVYLWATGLPVWSPDGHYLIDAFYIQGIMHPVGEPTPTAAGLSALGWESMPNMAIRDPALQRLLTSLPATTGQGGQSLIDVAWSPNGRVLAAVPEDNPPFGDAAPAPAPVTFYDSATAKTLETLEPQLNTAVTQYGQPDSGYFLRWSADGSHVLVYSSLLATITIWGPSVLPRSASA